MTQQDAESRLGQQTGARLRLVKNALANVLRGGASAIVAVLVPAFLSRLLGGGELSAWLLVLQLSALVSYLEFGVQTSVGRQIAQARELGDATGPGRIVSSALMLLCFSALAGLILIGILSWWMPVLFPDMPSALRGEARVALLLVGSSLALALPASAFTGLFVGWQRNEIPAFLIGGSRIGTGMAVILAAWAGGNLLVLSSVVAVLNLATGVLQWFVARHLAMEIHYGPRLVCRRTVREIGSCCLSLSVWSLVMLLVAGLDTTLVGVFDFPAVVAYSVAASFVACMNGLQNAVMATLIPMGAAMYARGERKELGQLLIRSTRLGQLLLLGISLPLFVGAQPLLTLWTGKTDMGQGAMVMQLLVLAHVIRMSCAPYSILLIAVGEQRRNLLGPMFEAVLNLSVALIAGRIWGAAGIALGTFAGATAGVAMHIYYNLPRTQGLTVAPSTLLWQGIAHPLVGACPLLLTWALDLANLCGGWVWVPACAAGIWIEWRYALTAAERSEIRLFIERRWPLRRRRDALPILSSVQLETTTARTSP